MPSSDTTADPARARILIVDDDDAVMKYLRACLAAQLEDAEITLYNSARLGRPGPDFDWDGYDVLLVDYNLGRGDTAVDWLASFGRLPGFPRTLLVTAEESPRIVGSAVRSGADGYLNKTRLDPRELVRTVRGMLPEPAERRQVLEDTQDLSLPDDPSAKRGPRYRGRTTIETGPGGVSYRFIRLIGRGGMSRVYLAERVHDRRTVVLKLLARDVAKDPENVKRFAREGELLARVDSPYVVHVYDHGFTNAYGYIAMEFFGRGDLAQRMEQGFSPEDAVLCLYNIACGLDAIHRVGIMHRDLKPANVMFRGDGSMAIADFGLAKRSEQDLTLTATGVILGTPYCMSPEQTLGERADHRTDLYGAGVIFYEMLTGKRPFRAANLPMLLLAIQIEPAPPLEGELACFQPVLDRLLAKRPEDRYSNAAELIAALTPII